MSRILLTAIGSMSALPALERYRELGHQVFTCDIYDRAFNTAPLYADGFFQSHLATQGEEYVQQMLESVRRDRIDFLIPLTDPEVDVLSPRKAEFLALGCILCTPDENQARLFRSKDEMNRFLEERSIGRVIPTMTATEALPPWPFPLLMKPRSGRSSQGLTVVRNEDEYLAALQKRDDYIVQPYLTGDIWCVDVARDKAGKCVALARREILRNPSGLGMTVETVPGHPLEEVCQQIAQATDLVGVVNVEFIAHNGEYYFLEVNPRFSGGVGFSMAAGADFAAFELICHGGGALPETIQPKHCILARESRIQITRP